MVGLAAAALLAAVWWKTSRTTPRVLSEDTPREAKPAEPPRPDPNRAEAPPLPEPTHHDFGLKVEMLASRPGANGVRELVEGQEVRFRIEVERDAYVGLWTIDPDGSIVQLFPSRFDPDHKIRAKQARTLPGGDYQIIAEGVRGTEQVRVVASTEFWDPIRGQQQGPFWLFKTGEERQQWERQLRGLVLKATRPQAKVALAEEVLRYQVVPAGNAGQGVPGKP
jgi:hypothetical protein